MARVDFSDDEHAGVTALVRRTIVEGKFPFSPQLAQLKPARVWSPASVIEPREGAGSQHV